MNKLSQEQLGTFFATLAFVFWGLVPIYFKALSHVTAFEVLVHRVLWSVVVLAIMITVLKQWHIVLAIFKNKLQLKILFFSSILVASNWVVFIWAIGHDKITEASLGYYINPLVNVALGMLFFAEKPSRYQILAILLAIIAIIYQVISLGSLPIISLVLAFSFGFYGLARKKALVASMAGLFIETLLISPLALAYLCYLILSKQSNFQLSWDHTSILLMFAGFITVIPLLWFNGAATRISMLKLGFLQYIGPTIAFMLAIFIYHEPFGKEKFITFFLIWLALAIFTLSDLKRFRKKV
ncbi:MAG: EamA family transporter RarD [Sulfurospirillum sp.]|nr:EamA family transporter RarD [Sulfurospirillum sp.]